MTTYQFHYPAGSGATLAIAVPEKLRGKPLKIVVEKEPAETGILSIAEILKDCPNENVRDKNGIWGLRGIMKGCTTEELEDARYEYLMKKYR